jgi:putative DNA primase/helicase
MSSYPDGSTASFGHSLPLSGNNGPTNGQARALAQVSILDIHAALGGKVSPHSTSKCWTDGTCWGPHTHGTDRYNLRLNDSDGVWSCHCGGKGGKLALIILAGEARDPKSAARWLVERGLLAERERPNGVKRRTTAMFEYHNEDGSRFARVDRVEPGYKGSDKDFYPRLWEGTGYALRSSLKGKKLPLYRLPEVRRAIDAGERLFLTEGEGKGDKLREALEAAKITAAVTTVPGGCSAPLTDEHLQQLRGLKSAVILTDSDEKGRAAAQLRAERIAQRGVEVRVLDLYPEATTKEHPAWAWDVADFLKDGGKVEDLLALIERAPLFKPSATATAEAPQKAKGKEPSRRVDLISGDTLNLTETEYVVYPYIPRGEATWLEGVTKTGKTMVACDIIARITRGSPFVNGEPIEQGNVAIITCEDDPERTLGPRLVAAGADMKRVFFFKVEVNGEERPLIFDIDMVQIEQKLREANVSLLFVDGTFGILNIRDEKSYAEAYNKMVPFVAMLRRLNIGTPIVRHLRKASGTALDRGMGSVGYGALARSTLTVAVDHHDKDQRIFAHAGNNVGPLGDSYAFRFVPVEIPGFKRPLARVEWGEQTDTTADEAVGAPKAEEERSVLDEAKEAILEALDSEPLTAGTLQACILGQGITLITFKRARGGLKKVGLIEMTGGGGAGPKMWRKALHLPATPALDHFSGSGSLFQKGSRADSMIQSELETVSEDVPPLPVITPKADNVPTAWPESVTLDDQGRELI